MKQQVLVAGGGIGGLAAVLACTQAGAQVRLFEQATQFSEVGAGIQLGPNVVRLLHGWGLEQALAQVAAFPSQLQVRDVVSGRELGRLRLGDAMMARYGAPYATIHRADLHGLLLAAVEGLSAVRLQLNSRIDRVMPEPDAVTVQMFGGLQVQGDLLVGADGVWSRVREQILQDGPPLATGHRAYRAMVPQTSLPEHLRSQDVTVWLGTDLHLVRYPVRGGEWLNVVALVEDHVPQELERRQNTETGHWDQTASGTELRAVMAHASSELQDLLQALENWRRWPLYDRTPLCGPQEMAQGRVALLGDAAHPMLPYLAQGAGMAIEDAAELGSLLLQTGLDGALTSHRYALNRWERNARVQARARRNGQIFHASGSLRLGRNMAMKLLGERLLDLPWLYQGQGG